MNKAVLLSILIPVMLLALGVVADAQKPKKVPRIAWLTSSPLSGNANRIQPFRVGFGELYRRSSNFRLAKEHLNNCVMLMREMKMGLWLERAEAELKEVG